MGLKMDLFFEMGGHMGLNLRGQSKRVNIRWPEGTFLEHSAIFAFFFEKTGNVIKRIAQNPHFECKEIESVKFQGKIQLISPNPVMNFSAL
jgi:hypothetical protein